MHMRLRLRMHMRHAPAHMRLQVENYAKLISF
jgi:hypothetical protein